MYEKIYQPDDTHTAISMGSGGLEVLATPALVAFLENAAYEYLQPQLSETDTSVGTQIDIQHLAASPVTQSVTVRILLVENEGRQYDFTLEAYTKDKCLAAAQHTRFVVNIERFLGKLNK